MFISQSSLIYIPKVKTYMYFFLVSLLKDLKHANIVTLHDIVHTPKSLTLVFEYLVSVITMYVINNLTCNEMYEMVA